MNAIRPHLARLGPALGLACIALLAVAPAATAQAPSTETASRQAIATQHAISAGPQRTVDQGIAIELDVVPVDVAAETSILHEGDAARFRFRITDDATGAPLSGLFPAAWMDLNPQVLVEDAPTCQEKVQAFIAGSLLGAPELDLNVYYVLALNDDATISVVDPLFGFGTTKLLAMVFLPSPGEDWALDDEQAYLYVSMPKIGQVAIVDTATWKLEDTIEVGSEPRRLALQADGRYLWVALDDEADAGVVALDTVERKIAARIATAAGPHDLVLADDDRELYVTNAGAGSVSIIDVASLGPRYTLDIGGSPISLAYSTAAHAAYAVDADGAVVAIDGERGKAFARIESTPGLSRLRFAPDGRLGFLVNPVDNRLHIIDAAQNRIIQTAKVEDGPDQIAFSDHLAYIGHRGSETVLMIPLEEVGTPGKPIPVVDFPAGQQPFGIPTSPGDTIVQAPGATAVLVANPADRVIYYYKEGMAAPMGQFQNYSRIPRAVLVIDRSLREHEPGVYETVATLRSPGTYDVAFFMDAPRTIHCFRAQVAAAVHDGKDQSLRVQPLAVADDARVGQTLSIRFRLVDAATGAARDGLKDVRVMTFRAPGHDQLRHPAKSLGHGIYEIEMVPAVAGVYYAFLESRSAGVALNSGPFVSWMVKDSGDAERAASSKEHGR